jgi:hypothetical protein
VQINFSHSKRMSSTITQQCTDSYSKCYQILKKKV